MKHVPPPLEWHPAYRDMTGLWDWLNGTDHMIRLPVFRRIDATWMQTDDAPPLLAPLPTRTLTKHKIRGWAPYVGRPFMYEWFAACDELNRWIAGEARIVYLPPSIEDPRTWL